MAIVIPAPSVKLANGLEVIRLRAVSKRLPANFSKPPDITFIPYRKNAKPPSKVKIEKIDEAPAEEAAAAPKRERKARINRRRNDEEPAEKTAESEE